MTIRIKLILSHDKYLNLRSCNFVFELWHQYRILSKLPRKPSLIFESSPSCMNNSQRIQTNNFSKIEHLEHKMAMNSNIRIEIG